MEENNSIFNFADKQGYESPFGNDSFFSRNWEEKKIQDALQRQETSEIVGIDVVKGDFKDKKLQNDILRDNLNLVKYRSKDHTTTLKRPQFKTVTITVVVTVKGRPENVYVTVNKEKLKASKWINNYIATFDLKIPIRMGGMKLEITSEITDFLGDKVFDKKKLITTVTAGGNILEGGIIEDVEINGNWYVDGNTGEYTWFDDKLQHEGFTRIGRYKSVYDSNENIINIYAGKEGIFIKSIDMTVNIDGKYKTEQAAKFAVISAECGGSYVNNDDPSVQPLIIGASIDNRLRLYGLGVTQYSEDGTAHTIKGYQATEEKAYKDFKYGNEARFGEGKSAFQKRIMNIGLSTVYNATIDAVSVLNEFYTVPSGKVKQFEQILYYAHGSGNTINGDFDVAIPEGTNGKFQYVRGSNKHKQLLSP